MYDTQDQFAIPAGAEKQADANPYTQPLRLILSGNLKRGCRFLAAACNADKLEGKIPGVVEMYRPAGVSDAAKAYARLKMMGDLGFGADSIVITPALAQIMLRHNFNNRNIVPANLEAYIAAVGAGDWSKNGETVILATDGTLNDGQHRLLAALITNQPFESAISYGVEKITMDTVDTGRGRRPGDRLSMQGVPSPHKVAAIYALAYEILNEAKPSVDQGRSFYAANEAAILSAFDMAKLSRATPVPTAWSITTFGAAAFLLLQGGAAHEKIEAFMSAFKTLDRLPARDPILTLRNGLSTKTKLSRPRIVLTIMAHYNLHRLRRPARGLVSQITRPAVEIV